MALKKLVKNTFIGLAAIIVLLLAVSLFLPSKIHVERQIIVEAPPASVFAQVNDFRKSIKWSPWLAKDPRVKLQFEGPEAGVGARMSWQSDHPEVGTGSQEITVSEKDKLVRVALRFDGQGDATAYFQIASDVSGAALIWGFDTETGWNPVMRYMGLMFDTWIGPYYERGLTNIKKLAEGDG